MSSSLPITVRWLALLKSWQLPVYAEKLPVHSRCPLCREETLTVIQDTTPTATWWYCSGCNRSGDPVRWVAFVEKITRADSLKWLQLKGFLQHDPDDKVTRRYLKQAAKYDRVEELYQRASRTDLLWTSGSLRGWRESLGVSAFEKETWQDHQPHILGVASDEEIRKAIGLPARQQAGFFGLRVIIPFYAIPGKLAGLGVLAGEQGAEEPLSYLSLNKDAGGVYHADCLKAGTAPLLVVLDPVVAVRWRVRGLLGGKSVPVTAVSSGCPPRSLLSLVGKRPMVVWSREQQLDHILFARAIQAPLWVSQNYANEFAAYDLVGQSDKWLVDYFHKASPWLVALAKYLSECPQEDAISAVKKMELTQQDLETLRAFMPDGRHQCVVKQATATNNERKIDLRNTVYRLGTTWCLNAKKTTVTNFVVRLEEIAATATGDQIAYVGEARCGESVIPFKAEAEDIKAFGEFITKKIITTTNQVPYVRHGWEARILEMTRLFSEPRVVTHTNRVGWDESTQEFRLAGTTIKIGGTVENTWVPDNLRAFIACGSLPSPQPVSSVELNFFTQHVAVSSAVAILYYVATSLLAGPRNYLPRSLVFCGIKEYVHESALSLGCLRKHTLPTSTAVWPTIVDAAVDFDWLAESPRNVIVATSEMSGLALFLQGSCYYWGGILGGGKLPPQSLLKLLPRILADFLHWLCGEYLRGGLWATDPLTAVSRDFRSYLRARGCLSPPEPTLRNLFAEKAKIAKAVCLLSLSLIEAGYLKYTGPAANKGRCRCRNPVNGAGSVSLEGESASLNIDELAAATFAATGIRLPGSLTPAGPLAERVGERFVFGSKWWFEQDRLRAARTR